MDKVKLEAFQVLGISTKKIQKLDSLPESDIPTPQSSKMRFVNSININTINIPTPMAMFL